MLRAPIPSFEAGHPESLFTLFVGLAYRSPRVRISPEDFEVPESDDLRKCLGVEPGRSVVFPERTF